MLYPIDNIEYQIMSELASYLPYGLSSRDLINAINDAHKDIVAKILCLETEEPVTTTASSRFVSFTGHKVNRVELSSTGLGLLAVQPQQFGHLFLDGTAPQYYFTWGNLLVIDPVPDAAYTLKLFTATAPASESVGGVFFSGLSGFTDSARFQWNKVGYITGLPDEFVPSIVDFCLYVLSIKLKQWERTAPYYNIYITNLSERKANFLNKAADKRIMLQIPSVVSQRRQQWAQ